MSTSKKENTKAVDKTMIKKSEILNPKSEINSNNQTLLSKRSVWKLEFRNCLLFGIWLMKKKDWPVS